MLGERMRRFRLARGMSLDDLEVAIGGLVSKQALSKYERGKMRPKMTTLSRIAAALGVKSIQLWGEPICHVEFVAYRKRARLGKKEQERLESFVAEVVEKRVRLQQRMGEHNSVELPDPRYSCSQIGRCRARLPRASPEVGHGHWPN